MQKFTIFTIIFSTIVLTVVAELVIQDYLQKVYPPASSLQANITTQDDFEFFYPDTEKTEEDPELTEEDSATNTVLEILEDTRESAEEDPKEDSENPEEPENSQDSEDLEEELPSLGSKTSTRIKTLFPALDIEGVKYIPGTPDSKIWDLVDTEDLSIKETLLGYFEVEDIIGSFYELETKNPLISEAIYEELKNRFTAAKEITINETNQFGQASYYVNHSVKVNEVFVVMRSDNFIYCFGYQKAYHDMFKNFFAVLL